MVARVAIEPRPMGSVQLAAMRARPILRRTVAKSRLATVARTVDVNGTSRGAPGKSTGGNEEEILVPTINTSGLMQKIASELVDRCEIHPEYGDFSVHRGIDPWTAEVAARNVVKATETRK